MVRMMVLLGATLGGSAGWWLGARFGFMGAFFVSVLGTAVGVYYARKWATGR